MQASQAKARADVERDRRLQPGEERALRATLVGNKAEGRERGLETRWVTRTPLEEVGSQAN